MGWAGDRMRDNVVKCPCPTLPCSPQQPFPPQQHPPGRSGHPCSLFPRPWALPICLLEPRPRSGSVCPHSGIWWDWVWRVLSVSRPPASHLVGEKGSHRSAWRDSDPVSSAGNQASSPRAPAGPPAHAALEHGGRGRDPSLPEPHFHTSQNRISKIRIYFSF